MGKTPEEKAADKAARDAKKAADKAAESDLPATEPASAPAAEAPAPEPEPAKPVKGEIVVKFRDHRGEPTERIFSREVHGPDFAKLAEEFKATNVTKLIA